MDLSSQIQHALSAQGPLARNLSQFMPRAAQLALAQAVAEAIDQQQVLVAEAGTGTGKTFAYLVPALLAGVKTVISTGTKQLQDQLFHRDLPLLRRALGVGRRVALLKGRANYVCVQRLQQNLGLPLHGTEQQALLALISAWAQTTSSGDLTELTDLPEDHPVWPAVTSTADNCLGQDCPLYRDCFVLKARRAAQEADVVVVNHHLLFADMALKEEGFGELLPGAAAFILDEAHQLPELASVFFGVSVSARQWQELARDSLMEYHAHAADLPALPAACEALQHAVREMRLALGVQNRRAAWQDVAESPAVLQAMASLEAASARLLQLLETLAERSKGLDLCWQRGMQLRQRWQELTAGDNHNAIRWFETQGRGFVLRLTPLQVAPHFQAHLARYHAAWVMVSATLSIGGRFEHYINDLGLDQPLTATWDSPFDYAHHGLLYVPPQLPAPDEPGHTTAVLEAALPVLEASGGRAFLLFTSHRALNQATQYLSGRLPYPLLVQGTAPRHALVERFRALGNAVLLGTGSFWEGVDVQGAALSCVIIDKLPFAAPDDPVLQARLRALRQNGLNPFMHYQLPQAVIALKQGVGRLIRAEQDRGVVMIGDPRLYSKSYGRIFLDSLPPMARSRDLAAVQRFFAQAPPRLSEVLGEYAL